uniref:Uncharacterized protein n=1 Tax=Candidatus Enterococcus mansonii TaxID=1834181 RepID=A0A242CDR3_9ENTE|nr:hypothetical protein A5880_002528 [Enterococcus sp. 4G2_DIV0659]
MYCLMLSQFILWEFIQQCWLQYYLNFLLQFLDYIRFEYLLIFKYFFCGMLMMLGIVFLTSYLNLSNSMMSNIIQIGFGLSLYFIFTGVLKVNPIIELGKGVVYERKK